MSKNNLVPSFRGYLINILTRPDFNGTLMMQKYNNLVISQKKLVRKMIIAMIFIENMPMVEVEVRPFKEIVEINVVIIT